MDALHGVLSFVALLIWLWAIPMCFLKGQTRYGWFGVIIFATGAVLTVTGSRYWRDGGVDEWWWWLFTVQGLVVLAIVVVMALGPAKPGSRWRQRRH